MGNYSGIGIEPRAITVAGGAGYIGTVLARRLLEQGHRVTVVDRCFFGEEPLRECFEFGKQFRLMITDTRQIVPGELAGADVVVDLAGLSNDPSCALDPGLTRAMNVTGGTNLLRASKKAGVKRYIYQSSCSVYGASGDEPIDETSPLGPLTEYSQSKVEMEEVAFAESASDFEVVVTRPGTVYGLSPRMRFDLAINTMTLAATQSGTIEIHGGGRQWRPFVHVTDVARAIEAIIEAPSRVVADRVFNVGENGQNFRIREVAQIVAAAIPGSVVKEMAEAKDARDYRCDFTRAAQELDFKPVFTPRLSINEMSTALKMKTVDTGIKTKTVEYYRSIWHLDPMGLPESSESQWSQVS